MATALGRLDPMITWPHGVTCPIKNLFISTSNRSMTAKLDKVEVYGEGPPIIEFFDDLIT